MLIRRLIGTIAVYMFKVLSYQSLCDALSYLLDNIYIRIGAKLYKILVFQRVPSLIARWCRIGRRLYDGPYLIILGEWDVCCLVQRGSTGYSRLL